MEVNFRRFRKRLGRKLALIIDRFKLVATIEDRDFGSQRMCPFCGLITSRRKTCCLECGKSLKPA
jgi:transposase